MQIAAAADESVLTVILTDMAKDASAGSSRRIMRADQLAADAAAVFSAASVSPTIMMGMGFRTAQQSAGYPAASGTGTDAKTG